MIAASRQLPRLNAGLYVQPIARPAARVDTVALLMGALGFFAFMPYPALNVGNFTAVQIGNFLTLLLAAPLLLIPWRNQPFYLYLVLLIPLCVSFMKVAILGTGELDLCFKVTAVWGLTCLTLPVIQAYGARYALHVQTGIAIATIIHTIVGLWQMHGFSAGYFPLTFLYVNNSFLSVQDNVEIIYRWIQRPFGLFPEPSAMSSSLAPWVLLWLAVLCNLVQLKQKPARWQRVLFGIAAAGGLALIIISRSGHAAVTLAAAVCFLGIWFLRSKATPQSFLALLFVFGVLLPLVLWQASVALSDRLGGASAVGNSSWEDRSTSLLLGAKFLVSSDPWTTLFGFGAGHSSPILLRETGLEAVWSVVLTYLYETGMVGVVFTTWVALAVIRAWLQAGRTFVFTAFIGVWFVGVMITTSYFQLLPIWVALGWMTIWPQVCQPVVEGRFVPSRDHLPLKTPLPRRHVSRFRREDAMAADTAVSLPWRDSK